MRTDAPAERIEPGQVVAGGRFALVEVLGRGGLATVFRARDARRGADVALKVLRDRYVGRPEREERLRREFEYAVRVEHPAVIEVDEQGTLEDGRPFFSMELIDGPPLSRLLSGSGGLPYERARRLARALAVALDAVHHAGIVHRDVKPANVLVLDDDRIKLIDFGMAGDDDAPAVPAGHTSRLTRANDLLGTHEYMAPEQVLKQPPQRSMDVFALGVVMYEMLSSDTPYSGMGVREYVELQIGGDPLLRSAERWGRLRGAPIGLAKLIDDCRRRDPERRPVDMREVIGRLDSLDARTIVSAATPATEPSNGIAVSVSVPASVSAVEVDTPVAMPVSAVTQPEVPSTTTARPVMMPVTAIGERAGAPAMATAVRESSAAARAVKRHPKRWRRLAWMAVPTTAAAFLLWVGLSERGPGSGGRVAVAPREGGPQSVEEPAPVGTPDLVSVGITGSPALDEHQQGANGGSGTRGLELHMADTSEASDGPEGSRLVETPPLPRPGASMSTTPEHRSKPPPVFKGGKPRPDDDACARSIARARAAFAAYRWPSVLTHTRNRACWSRHEAEYLVMRTEALMEEGRWSECVRTGRRSSDPDIRRHAERCQKRLDTISEIP